MSYGMLTSYNYYHYSYYALLHISIGNNIRHASAFELSILIVKIATCVFNILPTTISATIIGVR